MKILELFIVNKAYCVNARQIVVRYAFHCLNHLFPAIFNFAAVALQFAAGNHNSKKEKEVNVSEVFYENGNRISIFRQIQAKILVTACRTI